jgi:hypothetical protein
MAAMSNALGDPQSAAHCQVFFHNFSTSRLRHRAIPLPL